jgi:hypothetical protein
MIGYAALGTNNLAKAQASYDSLLAEIGAKRLMELPHGFTLYGTRLDRPALAITPKKDRRHSTQHIFAILKGTNFVPFEWVRPRAGRPNPSVNFRLLDWFR